MRIALASSPVKTGDISYNVASIRKTLETCCGKADLVLFGESALQGFDCLIWDYEADSKMAVSQGAGQIAEICEAAKRNAAAVSFGYIEKAGEHLYSSQIVIDAEGTIIHNFRRVSIGWKEPMADSHYVEGRHFERFSLGGMTFAIGLCGDLWTDGRPEEMRSLGADVVLWPVWCDYNAEEWNESVKHEYAAQAARCGDRVLLVNPFCADPDKTDDAAGGAVYFKKGVIAAEMPAGASGILIAEV